MFSRAMIVLSLVVATSLILYSKQELLIEGGQAKLLLLEELKPVNPKVIQPFLFGHEAFFADVFWIDTIQKSVDLYTPNLYDYIYKMVDLVTDLDPRFSQAYIWSNSALEFSNSKVLSRKEKVIKANKLLHKGWDYVQRDPKGWNYYRNYWMIPQILAYNYGIELKDKEHALEYTKILMHVPGLPAYMKTWAAGLYRKSQDKAKGIQFLENLLAVETLQAQIKMVDDREVKERLKGKLLVFYKNLNSDEYGYQRMQEIQSRVRDLVEEWRQNFIFLPFSFYTLMHNNSDENQESELIFNAFFPKIAGQI